MPTIEVGEFDKVFVVRRQPRELPENFCQVVELDEKDLVVTVEANRPNLRPVVKAFMSGSQLGMLQKLRIEDDTSSRLPVLEFSTLSPTIEELSDRSKSVVQRTLAGLKNLLPFATIHEMGLRDVVVQEHGRDLADLANQPPTQS
jgi:hypothetical protein